MNKKTKKPVKKDGNQKIMIVLEVGQIIKTSAGSFPIKAITREDTEVICNLEGWELRIPQRGFHEHLAEIVELCSEQASELSKESLGKIVEKAENGLGQVTHAIGTMLDEAATGLSQAAKDLKERSARKK